MKSQKEDCFHLGVKALIFNPKMKILLLERQHPSKGNYWDLPGGRMQKGESLTETLLREVKEETGLDNISEIHPFMMALTDIRIPLQDGDVGLIFSFFLFNTSDAFQPILSSEHVNFAWCSPLEVSKRLVAQYPKELIEKLSHL